MIFCKSLNGLIIGKCFLTQILKNPAQEVLFSRKTKVQLHPTINLSNIQVKKASCQKQISILLDEKLNFKQHIDHVIPKIHKGISVIKKTLTLFTTEIITYNI